MTKEVQISPDNFDVMQVVEVPAGVPVELQATGKGEAVVQGVLRYNLPQAGEGRRASSTSRSTTTPPRWRSTIWWTST